MQSGTTGINAIRIYNPIKQGIDHDPDGIFIKKWLPELRNVPKKYIHKPWEDIDYIKEYNPPIVEELEARKAAASKVYKLRIEKSHKIESSKVYIKHGSRKASMKKVKKHAKIKKVEIQKRDYGLERAKYCMLDSLTRYDIIAKGLGCEGFFTNSESGLKKAIKNSLLTKKTTIIDIEMEGFPAPSFS